MTLPKRLVGCWLISFLPASASSRSLAQFRPFLLRRQHTPATAFAMPPSFPRFSDVAGLHSILVKNLQNMKITQMTEIQSKTWQAASTGQDVLGRARTGTGKTISFLLPSLQQLLQDTNNNKASRKHGGKPNGTPGTASNNSIRMLVLSPTRELASQIHEEAQKLTRGCSHMRHQVVYGGSSRPKDVQQLERGLPTVLVATPGRLRDHLDNTTVRGQPFSKCFQKMSILVLDETDRLLDMGFQREVNEIIQYLPPKEDRQTLLFSATVPKEVRAVMHATMKPNFLTADCIHDQDPATHTNEQVEQHHVIVPYKTRLVTGTVQVIWELIQKAKREGTPLKMVVFFNTANLVAYYAALFQTALNINVLELHSRKTQSYRTRTADKFRAASEAILFTSDVSARGVDYPDVGQVVQVGIADNRESYIHRLGRTGRAGKVGQGLLVLYDLEQKFLDKLDGIDVPVHEEIQNAIQEEPSSALMEKLQPMLDDMRRDGDDNELTKNLQSAYRSMLGFYNGKLSKQLGVKDPATLIDFVNEFATQGGCAEIPGIEKKTIGKMGLRYTTGLNITANLSRQGGGRGGGGRGSAGGRGAPAGRINNNNHRQSADTNSNPKPPPKRQNSAPSTPEPKKPKTTNGGNKNNNNNRRRRGGGGRGGNRAAQQNSSAAGY